MRYFRIDINGQQGVYSSLDPQGNFDPGALNVEFDIITAPMGAPGGDSGAALKIWGIPLQTIAQSSNFNGKSIAIYGGMSKGLPLANPAQQGLLVQGQIQQCWGNWIGTAMTLDFIITAGANAPGTGPTASSAAAAPAASSTNAAKTASVTPVTPLNLIFNWKAQQPLAQAIKTMMGVALPGWTINTQISPQLVRPHDVNGYYPNLNEFGRYVAEMSGDIIAGQPYGGVGYSGVQLKAEGTTLTAFDNTSTAANGAKMIAFTDLVGQPTWQSAYTAQATCIMRGDIKVSDIITLPPSQVTIQGGQNFAPGVPRDTSIFQGNFQVSKVRHVGNFKQPRGESWVTVLDIYPVTGSNPTNPATQQTPVQQFTPQNLGT